MDEQQQRVLGGRYLLKDKVGTGGMAIVYRAQDQVLDRTVAVKIMLPQYAGDATFAARFKQEAQAAAALSSPYIVGVYDWGKDGDTYYIVMEYLRGTDLKSGVRSHGALDPKKVAQIGAQICSALSVAHKHEIIHRDIKPQNIMVLPDGNIKVMDFGIARSKNSHLTQDNNVLGTAHYVSPEQTRGQELGPTSDIYSLGVVMYECATGQVPFDGDDAISVALKQVNELPTPPSQVNPGVDAALERIILKCMEKDPANRFQTAEELKEVLNSYLAGRAVEVAEPTRVIASGVGADGATTRVMNDKTQAMARPAVSGQTVASANGRRVGGVSGGPSFEDPEPNGMSKGKIAGIVIGVVAAIAIIVFAVSSFMGGGSGVEVPNVMGMEQEKAVATLRKLDFEPSIDNAYTDSDDDKGKVVEQTPDGGERKPKGSKVVIVISDGKKPAEETQVPDLSNMTESEAEKALTAAKLKGKKLGEEADDTEKGKIFWQSEEAGATVEEGTTIEYKVSSGPEETNVPGVLGMSFSEASNALSSAGFVVVDGGTDYSDSYEEGQVMSQSVTGKAKPGTEVTLVVSLGSKTKSVDVDGLLYRGMSQNEAERAVANAGLRYDIQKQSSSDVEEGCLISYTPGGSVDEGTTITLVISGGPGASAGNDTGTDGGNDGDAN